MNIKKETGTTCILLSFEFFFWRSPECSSQFRFFYAGALTMVSSVKNDGPYAALEWSCSQLLLDLLRQDVLCYTLLAGIFIVITWTYQKKRILGYPSKVKFQHLFLKTGSAQLYLLRKDVPVHWLVCRAVPENVSSLRRQSRWHYYVECLVRRMSCIIYGKRPTK